MAYFLGARIGGDTLGRVFRYRHRALNCIFASSQGKPSYYLFKVCRVYVLSVWGTFLQVNLCEKENDFRNMTCSISHENLI